MKAMIKSDFITMKHSLGQLMFIMLVVALVMSILTETVITGTAAFAIMIPFMFILSIAAYDELNGWQRFRLTLPITRRQMVAGRYLGTLILFVLCDVLAVLFALVVMEVCSSLPAGVVPVGLTFEGNNVESLMAAIVLTSFIGIVVAAVTMPMIMRYGVTKATRLVPVVLVLLLAGSMYLLEEFGVSDQLMVLVGANGSVDIFSSFQLIIYIGLAVALVLYAVSAVVANKLYATRQF